MQKADIFTMLHLIFNTNLVLSFFSPFPIDFVVIQHLLNWRGKKYLSFLLATVGGERSEGQAEVQIEIQRQVAFKFWFMNCY